MTARCSTLAAGPSSPTYRATATSRRASEKTASGSSGQSLLTWLTPVAVAVEVAAVVEDVARAVVVEAVELRQCQTNFEDASKEIHYGHLRVQ